MKTTQAMTHDLLEVNASHSIHFVTDGGIDADVIRRQRKSKGQVANIPLVMSELRSAGLFVASLNAMAGSTMENMVRAIGDAMAFSEFSGINWDALHDRLRGLEWLPSPGYALFWLDSLQLWRESPYEAGVLTEVWLATVPYWERKNIPFHLVYVW